jgi:glycosyltransferase involved in cell wall biosynthesis
VSRESARSALTVVVVSHNYGVHLDEALGSVACQTRPADEVVLIDDGSSDDTPEVAARWTEKLDGLVSLRNETCLGPARTFNRAFAAARGELIVKLDGDDRLSENYLECAESALVTSRADIAYAGVEQFGTESARVAARDFDRRELMRENFINGSALMRRTVWERTGGYRVELDELGLEDWELFVHAVALGMHAVPVAGCWLEYRRHAGGSRNTLSRLKVLRAHLLVRQMHRDAMKLSDVGTWMVRSVRRNAVRFAAASR